MKTEPASKENTVVPAENEGSPAPTDIADASAPAKEKARPTRAEKKQAKRERKARWKEKKKERRAELISYYRDAPLIVRFTKLYLLRVLAVLSVLAVIVGGAIFIERMKPYIKMGIAFSSMDDPVSKEEIYAFSPLDEEGGAKIDALPAGNAEDTWAVYIYLLGADLEDLRQDSLSDLVRATSKKQMEEQNELAQEQSSALLDNYLTVLEKNGLTPPMFLYEPKDYIATAAPAPREYTEDTHGAATVDFEEMFVEDKQGKLSVVIETCGARKWNYKMVNPNRTQRFCCSNGVITEEQNLPIRRSSDPDTLADFLSYCKENHPADHTVLVLWNHGGGVFGYGFDNIFGGHLSLKDIRSALTKAYGADPDSPPLDIIGFDACLMGNLDVMHSLEGFADYYVLSEETEPNNGWHYTPWLNELSEHPETNPAQAARMIVDNYTDFYMEDNVHLKNTDIAPDDVTMSLIDAKKGAELYNAYCTLAKKQLIDSVDNIGVLAEIGRAGNKSTCFGSSGYNIYNLVDLGNYADNLKSSYPAECEEISRLLEETVMYHRQNGSLAASTGVSIYLPAFINSYRGTMKLLEYVFEICDDKSVSALYFYKTAGCLTDEMKEYVRSMTDREPQTLNTSLFDKFTKAVPVINGDKFTVSADPGIKDMITSYYILQASISDDFEKVVYYGIDELAEMDGEGNITSSKYDGKWICLEDQPLAPEIVSSTASSVEYRAKVLKDGVPVYLMFSCDRSTGDFTINGTKPFTPEDDEYYFINMKVNSETIANSKIVPVYEAAIADAVNTSEIEGKAVKCTDKTMITRKALKDSTYIVGVAIEDQRGDEYCSDILFCDISDGKINKIYDVDEYSKMIANEEENEQ